MVGRANRFNLCCSGAAFQPIPRPFRFAGDPYRLAGWCSYSCLTDGTSSKFICSLVYSAEPDSTTKSLVFLAAMSKAMATRSAHSMVTVNVRPHYPSVDAGRFGSVKAVLRCGPALVAGPMCPACLGGRPSECLGVSRSTRIPWPSFRRICLEGRELRALVHPAAIACSGPVRAAASAICKCSLLGAPSRMGMSAPPKVHPPIGAEEVDPAGGRHGTSLPSPSALTSRRESSHHVRLSHAPLAAKPWIWPRSGRWARSPPPGDV